MTSTLRAALFAVLATVGCSSSDTAPGGPSVDAPAGADAATNGDAADLPDAYTGCTLPVPAALPARLADTGLCTDAKCTVFDSCVHEFAPQWQLWSDGATKRRWIRLPEGAKIDTANMDLWRFPVGTRLWKQFTRDGVRVETRFMIKTGAADAAWQLVAYAWNEAQDDAIAVPDGQPDAGGTPHDIPSQSTCLGCHENVASRVLGFSAFSLDYSAPAGLIDLDDAVATGWLSAPPPGDASPHFPVPGTAVDRAALGYAHANCGHCHHSNSPLVNRPMLRLETDHIATHETTRMYESSVRVTARTPIDGASIIAKPGDPDDSVLITRTTTQQPNKRMPALGSEVIDPAGQQILRAWIEDL